MWIKRIIFAILAFTSLVSAACPRLSNAMDKVYGAGNWQMRSAPGDGTDIAPAVISTLMAHGELCIDRGDWSIKTQIPTEVLSGAVIRGVSSQASKVFYQRSDGAAFHFSGAGGETGGGLHGLAIILDSGYGYTSAVAVKLMGDSLYQPDQMMFSDLYITSVQDSYWFSGFYAHGNYRTSPKGIRAVNIENVQVFKSHGIGVWLSNIVQWSIKNIGVYVGIGAGNNLYVAGGGSYLTNSELVSISAASISGQFNITNVTRFDFSASCQSVATMANASIGRVFVMSCPVIGAFGPNVSVLSN